ncbi:origin recognition complex subunit 2-domain-containing protein [Peziza echinospora]|nr:origin recognition complex subunit 2-domain-containing protein [Peziza echinospora]
MKRKQQQFEDPFNLSPIAEGLPHSPSKRTNTLNPSPSKLNHTILPLPTTPSRRKRNLENGDIGSSGQTGSPRKSILKTPSKRTNETGEDDDEGDLWDTGIVRNADRSARRKGTRIMIQKAMNGEISDDDEDVDDLLANQIFNQMGLGEGDEEGDEDGLIGELDESVPTGGKSQRKKRGPNKKIQEKYAPPPLEGFESYFEQHRRGAKTSNSTLSGLPPLDLGEYYRLIREYGIPHESERQMLQNIHRDNFGQWAFELSQGFNIMVYGYGTKRKLLMEFAQKIWSPKNYVVVVNGYVSALTTRDILSTIFTTILGTEHRRKLGSNPNEMLETLVSLLDGDEEDDDDVLESFARGSKITLIIHSLDGEALRAEKHQALLAQLASHPRISVIASVDHIKAPLLWDSAKASQYNFLWHDATTFEPYPSAEASVEESLNMGGSGRAGGTKGVKYVLASLPQNAKELYRILVSHQLQAMEEDGGGSNEVAGEQYGVEYKVLYQKGVEEFICSNDMAFRTLLKEFHDHQMVTSRKDTQGTETLWAPFRKEELESILEDIMVA